MRRIPPLHFWLLACVLLICGCQWLRMPHTPRGLPGSQSILKPQSELLADAVIMEVLIIRCPYGDPALNRELWQDADEQILSVDLRKRLAGNGFRIGVVGNQIPYSLMYLMDMKDDVAPPSTVTTVRLDELENTPKLVRWNLTSRKNQRNEILASTNKENAMILFHENGTQGGEFYKDVQAVFSVKTETLGDGRVRVGIMPELQYGEVRPKHTLDAGAYRIVYARQKRTFDSLRGEVLLSPGQILILANMPEGLGNLGNFFLTDDEGDSRYQKIICLRMCQSPHHDLFTRDGTLPMDTDFSESESL